MAISSKSKSKSTAKPVVEKKPVKTSEKKPTQQKEGKLPDGTMTLNDAIEILKKKGINRSRQGIRFAAIQKGFASKHEGQGQEKTLIDIAKFREWLKGAETKIPAGWVTREQAKKPLNLAADRIYFLIKKYDIPSGFFGLGRGNLYFDLEKLRKAIEANKEKKVKKPTDKKTPDKTPAEKKKPAPIKEQEPAQEEEQEKDEPVCQVCGEMDECICDSEDDPDLMPEEE